MFLSRWIVLPLTAVVVAVLSVSPLRAAETSPEALSEQAFALFQWDNTASLRALKRIEESGRADAVPILVMALRYSQPTIHRPIVETLKKLTGADAGLDWAAWMLWQEAHPETGTIPGFAKLQSQVYSRTDPNFKLFLPGEGVAHAIRLEEIAWGGVIKDGIPALTNPDFLTPDDATYLNDTDLVFGVAINGDARAYPLRILDWHEMFNDVVGGVPVSLAYCTLCGSGILFETTVPGRSEPIIFGSSGFLYRSNKLMYDLATNSLWNQFTGRPVVGELTNSGIELKTRPVVITTWADWRARNPATQVLDIQTGYRRDYGTGAAYSQYFSSPELMFPTNVDQTKLRQKDFVFALRSSGAEVAWPLARFEGGAVINDTAGVVDLVLIGDAATRSVRAYRSEGLAFAKGDCDDCVMQASASWRVTEDALVGPDGRTLPRLPGHIAYWFAWSGYFGGEGRLAAE